MSIVAGRQCGVIHVGQLTDCGLTARAIHTATAKGQLHLVHRGVRAVGTPRLSPHGRYWAAVLAAGADTALCDLTAGALYAVRRWNGQVHVAAPAHRRDHEGVRVHHVTDLNPSMITTHHGLPVLKPQHVLLDLAARLTEDPLAIALNQALSLRLVTPDHVQCAIDTRPGHHGRGALTRALAAAIDDPGAGRTHQEFEALVMLELRALPGLPPYRRNTTIELAGGRIAAADLYFFAERVMVELDSRTWHEQRRAMDSDRRRDQQALAAGVQTFRITWRHVTRGWPAVSADLLATLRERRDATWRPSS